MNASNHLSKSPAEACKRAVLVALAAVAVTLPLHGQETASGDLESASGSVSQPASKQAQQVDQVPTAVKRRIEQPAEESPIDPTTARDGGPPAAPSSRAGKDPQQTAPAPNGPTPTTTSDHAL